MKYLFRQADYQRNLKDFDARLINYLDEKVGDILIDLKQQYNLGEKAFECFYTENSERRKISNVELFPKIYNDLFKLGVKDNIIALLETKIIYLWKIFEVKLKELIRVAYGRDTKKFHIWENIIDFFKEYEIPLKEINPEYYKLIFELKEVNNQCKHEGLIYSERINFVREFSNYKENDVYIPFQQVELFYERIKDIPSLYLYDIKEAIIKERLSFDESKYIDIATPIVNRMEHLEAFEFIKLLIEIYGFDPKQMEGNKG